MGALEVHRASSLRDFLVVRKIRNDCRTFMTRNQNSISLANQILFYFRYHASDRIHVLYIGENERYHPVAYGLITYDNSLSPWLTGGVLSGFRGQGYGTDLFKFLSSSWNMPIYLEVLESNQPARKLYANLGFHEISQRERVFSARGIPTRTATVITMKKG